MRAEKLLLKGEILDYSLECAGRDSRDILAMRRHIPSGAILVADGIIEEIGMATDLSGKYPEVACKDYGDCLLMPGFIDAHAHYPQSELIASYGESLLTWLEKYTFPTEKKFSDRQYADRIANFFADELLRNGTTTACVFSASFRESVDALFEAAESRGMLMISGQVMMDRHAPSFLLSGLSGLRSDVESLIKTWHGKGRLRYALTPRFAPSCSPELLEFTGQLKSGYPDLYIQTHLSENPEEVRWVAELFPDCKGYLDVYRKFGLLTDRSVFAHGIHLTPEEWKEFSDSEAVLAHCPTSNLFLGSGIFSFSTAESHGCQVAFGTDVGGGTSFSMLQTLQDAYKVSALNGSPLSPDKAFYHLTLGAARALRLADKIGNFDRGKDADIVVLDYRSTPVLKLRCKDSQSVDDRLFALMILGDDRAVKATYVAGKKVWGI